jgi:mono/diheme cytochrome c family protein
MRARIIWAAVAIAAVFGSATASSAQTPTPTEHGSSIYRTYCATCHGEGGRGDGPLAEALRRRPPDLTEIAARQQGVFPTERIYRIIDGREQIAGHGRTDMPVWGDAFFRAGQHATRESVEARIRKLVEFLDSIQRRMAQ